MKRGNLHVDHLENLFVEQSGKDLTRGHRTPAPGKIFHFVTYGKCNGFWTQDPDIPRHVM